MLTHTKFQEVDTIICRVSNEGLPNLVIYVYKIKLWKSLKKNLPVRPETATKRKRRRRKKLGCQLQSFFHYTQTQQEVGDDLKRLCAESPP